MSFLPRLFTRGAPAPVETEAVSAEAVNLRDTAIGTVTADKVMLLRSGARNITAGDDITMTLSGAMRVDAGGDMVLSNSGAAMLNASGELHMENSSGGVIVARDAEVRSGVIGLLLARQANLAEGTRVLATLRDVLLIIAGIGILYPLARALLARLLPPPPPDEARRRPWYMRLGVWTLVKTGQIGLLVLAAWLAYRWVRQRVTALVPPAFSRR